MKSASQFGSRLQIDQGRIRLIIYKLLRVFVLFLNHSVFDSLICELSVDSTACFCLNIHQDSPLFDSKSTLHNKYNKFFTSAQAQISQNLLIVFRKSSII